MTAERRHQLVEGAVVGLIGIAIIAGSLRYIWVADGRIGPGFLPGLAGLAVLASAAAIALHRTAPVAAVHAEAIAAVERGEAEERRAATVDVEAGRLRPAHRILIVLAIIIATVLVIPIIGFALACTLMVFVVTFFVEKRSILASSMTAAVTGLLLWGVFTQLLMVPLPAGIVFGG
ncbi:tripartite tricarboxylate transporter TctB family protein [Microbacterium sp. LWS13-1.2]|uniref:Tripartite tricarboxylate transporter TctB family protein n=1 Tax=Microbacterium sp. LWS13-1.2 TaxID=3135264 RepID=A0AAU6SE63_9MICO